MSSVQQTVPVTLEMIAREAGVSKNTVSVALRNKPGVSTEMRERIVNIAQRLDYKPNPMISALMHNIRAAHPVKSQSNIAFLHNYQSEHTWRTKEFFREIYEGVKQRCAMTGYTASVFWGREPGVSPGRFRDILLSRGISGIVVGPVDLPQRHVRLLSDDFAFSTLGYSLWRPALHRACTDMRMALSTAIRELKKLNYKRIGVAYSPDSDSRVEYSWTAALAVEQVKSRGHLCQPWILNELDPAKLKSWLRQEKPDVVISAGMTGIQQQIERLGYRIADDLGFVQMLGDSRSQPDIATVERHWNALGAAAVDLITAQLARNERGVPENRRTLLIEGRWKPGSTVRNQ